MRLYFLETSLLIVVLLRTSVGLSYAALEPDGRTMDVSIIVRLRDLVLDRNNVFYRMVSIVPPV